MTFTEFKNKWLGKRVDYDKTDFFQCVDLVKQYLYEVFGIKPGSWGNAIKYWTNTAPELLKKFDKIKTTVPKSGDIVVLHPVDNKPEHSAGHIGIGTGKSTSTTVEILEQNGSTGSGSGTGGNTIRTRFVPKSRIAGVLRRKATAPAKVYVTVKSGDTLTSIAKKNKLTLKQLFKLNPVTNFKSRDYDVIAIGEKVRVK